MSMEHYILQQWRAVNNSHHERQIIDSSNDSNIGTLAEYLNFWCSKSRWLLP